MLFIITTAQSRVASVLVSLEFCLRLEGHGNILPCSSRLSTSFPFSMFLIQRGSFAWHIFTSSSMDDNASSIARPFPSSINTTPASGNEDGSSSTGTGTGIISVQVPKYSGNGLEYMFISKSKEGGRNEGTGTIEWICRPPYREVIQQTRSNCTTF